QADDFLSPLTFHCACQIFRHPLPARNHDGRQPESIAIFDDQDLVFGPTQRDNAICLAFVLNYSGHFSAPASRGSFSRWSSISPFFFRESMKSRMSFAISAVLAWNSQLMAVTMSDSVEPCSRSSRIFEPTRFRLNIRPCSTSSTTAPSCTCVLRTPLEILYMVQPRGAVLSAFPNRMSHVATWRSGKAINL